MTGVSYLVVYTGNTPTDAMVISQSFSTGIGKLGNISFSATSSTTQTWNIVSIGLEAGKSYKAKLVHVGSAGATATASMTFQTLIPVASKDAASRRKRRVLYTY